MASVGLLVAVAALFLWVRRRRQRRIEQRPLPEQLTEAQQEISQDTLLMKADGAQGPDEVSPTLPQTEPGVVGLQSRVQPPVHMADDVHCEETLAQRVRRMEAWLDAMEMGLPDSSPPRYTG